ncbi:GNAT family N-acetyltransferase (plasmid) [Niallia taxi]|nr:GNAT family N-acetyltransferase [Niallia taxi]MCT2345101.1 GNAT family N-acetyltransferase [Niallia taxi]MDE5052648.1 GNAT family N-acetyltransferase [Niallia taxi]WOD65507.1 GNAT family N-acetyltransferase [Niallia taxi]
MNIIITNIHKEEAWEIRHKVMWPDKEFEFIKLDNDESGIHYGLYKDNQIVSVLSLFVTNNEGQFRKFATLSEEQGNGFGSVLLNYVIKEGVNLGLKRIWCNAREQKVGFYQKFGMQATGEGFMKAGKAYIIMEMTLNNV